MLFSRLQIGKTAIHPEKNIGMQAIFFHNLSFYCCLVILGALSYGVFSYIGIFYTLLITGVKSTFFYVDTGNFFAASLPIIPHGIFELLAFSIAVSSAIEIDKSIFKKQIYWMTIKPIVVRVSFGILLLFAAAFFETNVSTTIFKYFILKG